jgi:hypothetical protein
VVQRLHYLQKVPMPIRRLVPIAVTGAMIHKDCHEETDGREPPPARKPGG